MNEREFLLVIEGCPACLVPAGVEPLCSLWAWAQLLGLQLDVTPMGCRLNGHPLLARISSQGGALYASVLELATASGYRAEVDWAGQTVLLWKQPPPSGTAVADGSVPLPDWSDGPRCRELTLRA